MSPMVAPPTANVASDLRDVHETQNFVPYLKALWARRGYIWFVSVNELRSRQMTTALGNLWHLLNPLLQILVYYLIFGIVLEGVSRGTDNFVLFLTVGVLVFADIQRITTAGGSSIVNNRGILQAISFPRALLPLTAAITETLAALPNIFVIYLMAVLTGETPDARWLLLPLVMAIQFWFNLGCALLAARATTHFRDMQQILPFLFRILLYTSGIIFSVEAFTAGRWYGFLFDINPIYCYISIARWTVLGGELASTWVLSASLWTVAVLFGGFWWFRRAEERYGRD